VSILSLVHCDRLQAIEKVKKTGELPTVQAGVLQTKLPDTPGMIELLSADDSDSFSGRKGGRKRGGAEQRSQGQGKWSMPGFSVNPGSAVQVAGNYSVKAVQTQVTLQGSTHCS
jgi:hypothetical protein